jgi:hypothetical protein
MEGVRYPNAVNGKCWHTRAFVAFYFWSPLRYRSACYWCAPHSWNPISTAFTRQSQRPPISMPWGVGVALGLHRRPQLRRSLPAESCAPRPIPGFSFADRLGRSYFATWRRRRFVPKVSGWCAFTIRLIQIGGWELALVTFGERAQTRYTRLSSECPWDSIRRRKGFRPFVHGTSVATFVVLSSPDRILEDLPCANYNCRFPNSA